MSHGTASQVGPEPEMADDSDLLYEVIDGEKVEIGRMGVYETEIASMLCEFIGRFARTHKLGRIMVETLFDLGPAVGRKRRPDLAFVSKERWPLEKRAPRTEAWDVVPDLAIEIVSPTNLAEEVQKKIHDYFRAGVRRVWVIYPDEPEIYVYDSPSAIAVLGRQDTLADEQLLPGFQIPVAALFEPGQ